MKKNVIYLLCIILLIFTIINCSDEVIDNEGSDDVIQKLGVGTKGSMPNISGVFFKLSTSTPNSAGHTVLKWNGSGWSGHGYAVRVDVDTNGDAWVINNNNQIWQRKGNDWIFRGEFEAELIDIAAGPSNDDFSGKYIIVKGSSGYYLFKWVEDTDWTKISAATKIIKNSDYYEPRVDVFTNGQYEGYPVFTAGGLSFVYTMTDEDTVKYLKQNSARDLSTNGAVLYCLKPLHFEYNVIVYAMDSFYDDPEWVKVTEALPYSDFDIGYPARNLTVDENMIIWASEKNNRGGSWLYYWNYSTKEWNHPSGETAIDISLGH